jgi:hypothetical protein
MAKLLVLYYSTYGHVETMANAGPPAPPRHSRRDRPALAASIG